MIFQKLAVKDEVKQKLGCTAANNIKLFRNEKSENLFRNARVGRRRTFSLLYDRRDNTDADS